MDEDRIVIMMTSGPDTPRRCATPFFMATLAAAMEYDVTIFFTVDGTLLLKKGMAATVFPKEGGRSVESYLNDALEAGVKLAACSASTELHGLKPEDLIAEVKMVGGATFWQMTDGAKTVVSF